MVKKSRKYCEGNICQVIGAAGTGRGVGTTHFCVLTANYLSGYLRKKTALLEWNSHGDLERMEKICTGRNKKGGSFNLLDVSYYKNAGSEQLTDCMETGFQSIVVDFGVWDKKRSRELILCGKRILIGSFTEWQENDFLSVLAEERGWTYAAVFGSRERKEEVKKKIKAPVLLIPYHEDAFSVTSALIPFFQELFRE